MNNPILSSFDFTDYLTKVDQENLKTSPKEEWRRFIQKELLDKQIDIDYVYFSGNYAGVYFKSLTDFTPACLKEICVLHRKIWNQRQVPFFCISTPTEIRAYNCFKPPIDPDKNLNELSEIELFRYSTSDTAEHLENLVTLFSRIAIDTGTFWKEKSITKEFDTRNRVDQTLIRNLKFTGHKLRQLINNNAVVHDLLLRSLFVLYLEDIGATDSDFYQNFKAGSRSYFDLLGDKNATYQFFKQLETTFNGNLFIVTDVEYHLKDKIDLSLIRACFWGEDVRSGQQTLWKMFDFSIIPIELISEIYEIFLKNADITKSKEGEYYTPHSLVDFILNESLPWANKEHQDYQLKILDPACGSGIFLVEAFHRLVNRWEYANSQKIKFDALKYLLLNSIYGFEINPDAIKVAAFSLYLSLLSYLEPKSYWKDVSFPYLIFEPQKKDAQKQGKNLFRQSSLSNNVPDRSHFDLIIGNPPFKSAKTGSLPDEFTKYCLRYSFAQEMVLPFLHRASELCAENGKIALLSTSKILFNKSGGYQTFREFLFKETLVETIVNFSALRKPHRGQGKSIFANAVGPTCVLFYRKRSTKIPDDTITYCCPKPTAKDKYIDTIILDKLDFYYLPRAECEKKNTVIWKVAMWGTERDYQLIKKLLSQKPLRNYLTKKNGWYKGVGLQFLTNNKVEPKIDIEIPQFRFIEAEEIERHYTLPEGKLQSINDVLTPKAEIFYLKYYSVNSKDLLPFISAFRRSGAKKTNYSPHVLLKTGQSDKEFCAAYLDYDCYFKDAILGISFDQKNLTKNQFNEKNIILKALTTFLNSKFASYFLFLTSMSWGIEREKVLPQDVLSLPTISFEIAMDETTALCELFNKISKLLIKKKELFAFDENEIVKIENNINEIIYKALDLSERELYLIEDVFNFSLNLFQEGEQSMAYLPVPGSEMENYITILCKDLNDLLQFSNSHVWASLFEVSSKIPIRMVALQFSDEYQAGYIQSINSSDEINTLLKKIDALTYEKHSESIYYRKVVKHFVENTIYIIKPNEKRFWSRSQAMQDADDIAIELANMQGADA